MKISKETRNILSNFSNINTAIMFRTGSVLRTMAQQQSVIVAKANVAEIFPKDFGIYELSKFLGVFSLFEDPDITVKENVLEFKEGHRHINLTFCTENLLKGIAPNKDFDIPSNVYGSFQMDEKAMKHLTKAFSVLKSPNIIFQSDGDTIMIHTTDIGNSTSDTYSTVVGKSEKVFKVIVNTEAFSKIMPGNYEISIQYGNRSDSTSIKERFGVICLKAINLEYLLSSEPSSTYQ